MRGCLIATYTASMPEFLPAAALSVTQHIWDCLHDMFAIMESNHTDDTAVSRCVSACCCQSLIM